MWKKDRLFTKRQLSGERPVSGEGESGDEVVARSRNRNGEGQDGGRVLPKTHPKPRERRIRGDVEETKKSGCSGNGRSPMNGLTPAHLPPMEPKMHGDESGDEVVARSRNRDGDGEGKDGDGEVETETERVKTRVPLTYLLN